MFDFLSQLLRDKGYFFRRFLHILNIQVCAPMSKVQFVCSVEELSFEFFGVNYY